MIRSWKGILLLFCIIFVVKCEKIGLTSENFEETKVTTKSSLKSNGLTLTKADLDFEKIAELKELKAQKVEAPKVVGDEFVAEKVVEQTHEDLEQSNSLFSRAVNFIERGKGHGRDGKLAAYRLFEDAATLGHTEAKKLTAYAHLFGDFSRWSLTEAKESFSELEKLGSPDAQLALGFMHATGVGVEKSNQAKAITYYMFSALGGNPLAQMAMGYRYNQGVGVPQNCESALSYYQKVAKTVAENIKYSTGPSIQRVRLNDEADPTIKVLPGTTPLDQNLLEYYKMLAEKGDVSALLGLGQLYLAGSRGVLQNFEQAYNYLTLAADAGNMDAFTFLGRMYLDGTPFTPYDPEKAFEYLLQAAERGNPSAQATLGTMYLKANGVYRNYEKALKLLNLASDKKNVDGQLYLAEMHFKGIPTSAGIKRDYKKALKLFQMASQNGHVLGYYNLAQMHASGTGVPRNCQHAVELFKSVAERGKWGERMMEAYSAYKDSRVDEAAMKYLFMSELGYEVAQTNLAFILDRGEATALFPGNKENNLQRAFVNWQRSANQEYPHARIKLGDYHYYGLGTEVDYSLAYLNYKIAVDRHAVAQAMFNLGYMHEVGEGISRDLHLAKRYYDQAIEHSLDAYVPSKLALAKLGVVFFFDELNKHPLIATLETMLGPGWDIVVMSVLAVIITGYAAYRLYEQRQLFNN